MDQNSYISTETSNQSKPPVKPAVPPKRAEEPKMKPTVANAARYVSAEMSLQLYGPVPQAVFEERKSQCLACPQRSTSTVMADEIGFCSRCGCGVNERSRLTVKLTMPNATCPLNKWQPAEGRHDGVVDRAKAWVARKILGT